MNKVQSDSCDIMDPHDFSEEDLESSVHKFLAKEIPTTERTDKQREITSQLSKLIQVLFNVKNLFPRTIKGLMGKLKCDLSFFGFYHYIGEQSGRIVDTQLYHEVKSSLRSTIVALCGYIVQESAISRRTICYLQDLERAEGYSGKYRLIPTGFDRKAFAETADTFCRIMENFDAEQEAKHDFGDDEALPPFYSYFAVRQIQLVKAFHKICGGSYKDVIYDFHLGEKAHI